MWIVSIVSTLATLVTGSSTASGLLISRGADKSPPAAGVTLTYSGTIRATDPTADERPVRSFRIHFLVTEVSPGGCKIAWVLEEGSGSPRSTWPQRFGSMTFNRALQATGDREAPAIQAERDSMARVIPIRLPLWPDADRLNADARWEENDVRYEVISREQVADRRSWKIGVSNRLGPREMVWVNEQEPVVTRHRELVFLGQGVAHELALDLERSATFAADDLSRQIKSHTTLANLRGPVREKLSELAESAVPATSELLQQARTAASDIQMALGTGIYVDLARDVVREIQSAVERQKELGKLSDGLVGKQAKGFSLNTTRGDRVTLADFKGKPVALHFWEYRSEPKIAPYGETGYLDFLWRQRQKQGIAVLGIAVDNRLRDETTRAAARKDIRAFCEFMNLSYPVAFDDAEEKVIDRFGDPRAVGGKLPLYVIIAPDGVVAEYHPGLWSKAADEGLKELDERLLRLVR
jgi:peroxiredoxin